MCGDIMETSLMLTRLKVPEDVLSLHASTPGSKTHSKPKSKPNKGTPEATRTSRHAARRFACLNIKFSSLLPFFVTFDQVNADSNAEIISKRK